MNINPYYGVIAGGGSGRCGDGVIAAAVGSSPPR